MELPQYPTACPPPGADPQYVQAPLPAAYAPNYMQTPPPGAPAPNYMQTPPPGAPAPNYMQAPPPVMVVTTQPTSYVAPDTEYNDYLGWSICNLLCLCLPLGIVALVFSIQTRDANSRHDASTASRHSRSAFTTNIVATVLGLCITFGYIGYVIYYIVAGSTTYYTYYG